MRSKSFKKFSSRLTRYSNTLFSNNLLYPLTHGISNIKMRKFNGNDIRIISHLLMVGKVSLSYFKGHFWRYKTDLPGVMNRKSRYFVR